MRKLGAILFVLATALAAQGQETKSLLSRLDKKNILNHIDVGVNVGTTGIGINVAVPVTDYVRIRAGYDYMPPITLRSDFPIQTRSGSISHLIDKVDEIPKKLQSKGLDINSPGFEDIKQMYDKFSHIEAKDYVSMKLQPNMHQFKFLVDVMPFRNNKHWSFTAGFFLGNTDIGEANNYEKETLLLEAVSAYNDFYAQYPEHGIKSTYLYGKQEDGSIIPLKDDPFYRYGLAGFPLGYFEDGEKAMMVPGEDNTVSAQMEISPFRPYVGFGYNTPLSRNKRWNLNVDAGVLFICKKPKVYVNNVYKFDASDLVVDEHLNWVSGIGTNDGGPEWDYGLEDYFGEIVRRYWDENFHESYISCANVQNNVDLMRDVHDIPSGKVRDMVNFFSKMKVYPNLSVTVSYRLF